MSSAAVVSSIPVSDSFRDVAVEAALQAGAFLRSRFGARHDISYKGSPTNLVTEMDRGAETIILDAIHARFPGHAVLAEESGARSGTEPYRGVERSAIFVGFRGDVGFVVEQQFHDGHLLEGASQMQRCPASVTGGVYIGS